MLLELIDHCGCSQEVKTENLAVLYNLYSRIDKQNLECLNEVQENSGRDVFRPWDERLLKDHVSVMILTKDSHLSIIMQMITCTHLFLVCRE